MPRRDAAVKGDFDGSPFDMCVFTNVFLALISTPGTIFQILFVPKLFRLERKLMDIVLENLPEAERRKLKFQLWECNVNSRGGSVHAPMNVFQQWRVFYMGSYSFRPFKDAPGHFTLLTTVKFLLDGKEVTFDLFSLGGVLHSLQFNRGIDERRTDIEILSVDTEPVVLDERGNFLRFA